MAKISEISGRKILDSKGTPTVEVQVKTESGNVGIDSVPSGTSTGKYEAALVNVDVACSNVNKIIAPKLIGMDVSEQEKIDQVMQDLDGTENKSKLGANAILGVSLASCRAGALEEKIALFSYINRLYDKIAHVQIKPALPTPMMVMICGGKHVINQPGRFFKKESEVGNSLCVQEFSVIGKLEDGINVWHALEDIIKEKKLNATLGLEGAFSLKLPYDEDAIILINEACQKIGLRLGQDVHLGLDIAGNHCQLNNEETIELFRRYPLFSVEDPFAEDEWEKFGQLKLELEELRKPFLLIGDDLFATHKKLLEKGISQQVANSIIIKPNQVGTLTETLEIMGLAYKAKYTTVVSHRSGETIDTFISDLAVGTAAGFLKAGAPIPNERLLKYKRLKEIEQTL